MRKIVAGSVALALCAGMAWAEKPEVAPAREAQAQYPPAFGTVRSVSAGELVLADALGKQWTFRIGRDTQAQLASPGERAAVGARSLSNIPLSDIKPGMLAHVSYGLDGRSMTARRVVAQQTPTPGNKPVRER